MKKLLAPLAMATVMAMTFGSALAKLPPLDDAAKAKAAEAAAKTAWQGKVDAWQTCKVQDKVAAYYQKTAAKSSAAKDAKPATAAASATAVTAQLAPSMAAAASAASAVAGTPVAAVPLTPCADPGPFAYNPPEQKPLEASGAHSPAGNATSPPSVRAESAQMAPAKK